MIEAKKYAKINAEDYDMKKKLFNTDSIEKICANCLYGKHSPDGENVLCTKKGVMLKYSSCRAFEYDPLNRMPARPLAMPEFSAEDFEL